MPTSKETSDSTRKPRRWGRLLAGCGLTLAMLAVLAAVAVVLTLRVVEQRWESSLRSALETATGGEISFEDLNLGLRGTTLTEVRINDSAGQPVLTAQELELSLNPWSQTRDNWQVDAVSLTGVELSLHRDDLRWGLPETSIGMLLEHDLQEIPWPELRIDSLELSEISVELKGPESSASLTLPSLTTSGLVLSLADQARLELGPVTIPLLDLTAPDGETIHVSGITAEIAPWGPTDEQLTVTTVQIEQVNTDLGAQGWRVPDAAAATLTGGDGIPWPTVAIESVTLGSLALAAGGGEDRTTVRVGRVTLEPTSLTLGPVPAVAWGPVSTGAVSLASKAGEVVTIDTLHLSAGSIDPTATRLDIPHVTTGGLTATLRKGERWFAVPTGTWALFGRPGAPDGWSGLRVAKLEIGALDAGIVAASGTLAVRCPGGEASAVGLDPTAARPWSVGSAVLRELSISTDEPFATITKVTLNQGGLLEAEGVELWTRLRKNRSLKLPPVVQEHAPSWIGGEPTSEGAWFGVDLGTLPWQPTQARLRDATIHLDDARNSDPPLQWVVSVSSASMGPMGKDRLPFTALGTVAEGRFEASGGMRSSGQAVVNVAAKQISLKALTPYVDDLLDTFGMKVKAGTVGGDLKLSLNGSRLKIEGPARARRIEMGGKSGVANLANATLQALTGERTRVDLNLDISGDLTDGDFSPFRLVLAAVVQDLVGVATDALGEFLENLDVEESGGKKKGKKKNNQDQAEQVIENIAAGLQDALSGGNNNNGGNKKNSGKKKGGGKKKK